MTIPQTYRGLLATLIKLAEHGNNYDGRLTEDEQLAVGALLADIQNSLGEMQDLLDKLNLDYNASI